MPWRDVPHPAGQAHAKNAEHADGHRQQNDHQRPGEPRVGELLTPADSLEAKDNHTQRRERGDDAQAEDDAQHHALGAVMLGGFKEAHRLDWQHWQHARHNIEEDAHHERREHRNQQLVRRDLHAPEIK